MIPGSRSKKTDISGWGNYPAVPCAIFRPEKMANLDGMITGPLVARGLGRSYGDAALNERGAVVFMERLERFLKFDEHTGILRAEAGVSLETVLHTFVPRGWFVPVTPGTQHVTLGGCLASDIHGKNHHRDGPFSHYVIEAVIKLASGERKACSPAKNKELFSATAGGMGLTGIITEISLQMLPIQTPFISVQNHAADCLENTLAFLSDPKNDDRYSVAWIDCLAAGKSLGRGIIMTGHHAAREEISKTQVPSLPKGKRKSYKLPSAIASLFLNSKSVKLFNGMYYLLKSGRKEPYIHDFQSYFYPLDLVKEWNSFYGKKGFIQYQFSVPKESGDTVIKEVLEILAKRFITPFLAVLKRFGPQGLGYLSFPMEGFTLALDIPWSPELPKIINSLDAFLIKSRGRVYLAKDALLQPESFRLMYPDFFRWQQVKNQIDPGWIFSSNLSRRLKMEEA